MNRSLSQYRLITGIKSHRSNPIMIQRDGQTFIEASQPEAVNHAFEATDYDKDYAFNCTQYRWFRKQLELGEEVIMTADQLKMICDEVHEMGRLRERVLLMAAGVI